MKETKEKEKLIKSENGELEDDKMIKSQKNYQESKDEKDEKDKKEENNPQINTERELEQQTEKEKNNIINKSPIEEIKINDDETVNKMKSLFESIKNFDQLKNEVYSIKKNYEYLNQLSLKSLEEKQKNNLDTFNQKFSELNKKFDALLGNNTDKDQDQEQELEQDDSSNENDIIQSEKEKSENEEEENNNNKPKMMNLSDINALLKKFEYSKANITDLSQVNDDLEGKIKDLSNKIDNLKLSLFGIDKDDKKTINSKTDKTNNIIERDNNKNNTNAQRFNFINKSDFEKFIIKSEEEHNKIWKDIVSLRLVIDTINDNFNNKATLDDLEELKNIILDKTEELFLGQNKKIINYSSTIKILQDNFKKLLKLLSEKEQYSDISSQYQYDEKKKRSGSGGYSCASCETYIGDLKIEPKHINWNQFPKKGKDNGEILQRVQNGYSRLLQMINFDSNGNPLLAPYTSNINSDTNISSNIENNISQTKEKNDINQSFANKRLFSSKVKKLMKENNNTIDLINSKKDELISYKKLPTIKTSKSIDNFQNIIQKPNQKVHQKDIYFINPALNKVYTKLEKKNV